MPLMKEKRLHFKNWELAFAMDAQKADRLQRSIPFRALRAGAARVARPKGPAQSPTTHPEPSDLGHPDSAEAAALRAATSKIKWYHTIDLGQGVVTPGMVDLRPIAGRVGIPEDLTGMRCLDVGTYDGFWAFEMERRGAAEVIAMDLDSLDSYDVPRMRREAVSAKGEEWVAGLGQQQVGEGIKFAIQAKQSKVRREIQNVYELTPERFGMFDVVFTGYMIVHLRDPQTALENIASVTRGMAILVEPFEPDMEGFNRPMSSFQIGQSNVGLWWHHNTDTWKALMASAGFARVEEVSRTRLEFNLAPRDGAMHTVHTLALRGYPPPSLAGG
jgi:tRNA (mo5U34)-methyltransferase